MKNLFNPEDTVALLRRLEGLRADARPTWGRMTPREVVCHLADPMRVALGQKEAKTFPTPFGLPVISHATIWFLPWPKSAPTAPEFIPGRGMTAPADFEKDKAALVASVRQFSEVKAGDSLGPHPLFGSLSHRTWGRLMWRHLDHHLRQFGL